MPPVSPPVKWLLGVLAAAVALSAGPVHATPADEALRLVPPETAICFVAHDLRTHARMISESPFAAWVESSGFLQQFVSATELTKLKQLSAVLALQLGVTPVQLRDDVLGDAVVFAYQPGPPGRPDDESGLVLVRPRKPDVLAGLVARVNDLQRASGELRAVREKTHRGQTYFEREQSGGGREFYVTAGGVFAFSKQEAAIRAVIDRGRDAAADDTGPVATSLKRLGLSATFAVCWFNPRAFDAQFDAQAAGATKRGERAFLDQFRKLWSATECSALYAHPGRDAEIGLVAALDDSRLPSELRPLLFPPAGGSGLWSVVPDDTILAVGGRIDVPKLLAAVGSFLPADGKDGLKSAVEQGLGPLVGRDKLPAVLKGLGPEWAAWVTPPAGTDAGWVPGWTVALKLGTGEDVADVGRSVHQAIDFAAQMARFAYNRDHTDQIELGEERQGAVTVKYLANTNGFPAGQRPAYAVKHGYLVIASSPTVVGRFAAPGANAPAEAPLLRLSARHLRGYLSEHRKSLAAVVAKSDGKTPETVEKELNQFGQLLEAAERVEVRYAGADGRVRLSVHVELVKPLGK